MCTEGYIGNCIQLLKRAGSIKLSAVFLQAARWLGIDRAISYGVLAKVWGAVSGLVTIFIIASSFTSEQQGYYYTISSLLALQIFFELGLMTVIAQFASHEFVSLSWGSLGEVQGDSLALDRFLDLTCKTTKWFGIASVLMVVGLIPLGLLFLGKNGSTVTDFSWQWPWIFAVLGTSLNLFVTPFFAVIMGSGDVAAVNYRVLIGAVVGSCAAWIVMVLHGGLYAVAAVAFGNLAISWSYLVKYKPELLRQVWIGIVKTKDDTNPERCVSWWGEVWPMQWKIALSWISGYFVFQLFNLVLFRYHGAAVAGQMGMTLSASNALLGACITWMTVKTPEFGKLIAKREWRKLDQLFYCALRQSIVIAMVGAIIGWSAIWLTQTYLQIGQRFIPASQAGVLFGSVVIQTIITGLAVYLRAHKEEPLLAVSVVAALIQGPAVWFLAKYFSSLGATLGFFLSSLFYSLPAVYFVWKRYRNIYHQA